VVDFDVSYAFPRPERIMIAVPHLAFVASPSSRYRDNQWITFVALNSKDARSRTLLLCSLSRIISSHQRREVFHFELLCFTHGLRGGGACISRLIGAGPVAVPKAALVAAGLCGQDGEGKDQLIGYFVMLAREHPAVFARLLLRILPIQSVAEIDGTGRYTPSEAAARLRERGLPVPPTLDEAADAKPAT
jgi:hypothetical protein